MLGNTISVPALRVGLPHSDPGSFQAHFPACVLSSPYSNRTDQSGRQAEDLRSLLRGTLKSTASTSDTKALLVTTILYTARLLCTSTAGNASVMQTCFLPTTVTLLSKTILFVPSTDYERKLNNILGSIWADSDPICNFNNAPNVKV